MMEFEAPPVLQPQAPISRMPSCSSYLLSLDPELIPERWQMAFSGRVPVGMEGVLLPHHSPLSARQQGGLLLFPQLPGAC